MPPLVAAGGRVPLPRHLAARPSRARFSAVPGRGGAGEAGVGGTGGEGGYPADGLAEAREAPLARRPESSELVQVVLVC